MAIAGLEMWDLRPENPAVCRPAWGSQQTLILVLVFCQDVRDLCARFNNIPAVARKKRFEMLVHGQLLACSERRSSFIISSSPGLREVSKVEKRLILTVQVGCAYGIGEILSLIPPGCDLSATMAPILTERYPAWGG